MQLILYISDCGGRLLLETQIFHITPFPLKLALVLLWSITTYQQITWHNVPTFPILRFQEMDLS
jgi:hypothetical protein